MSVKKVSLDRKTINEYTNNWSVSRVEWTGKGTKNTKGGMNRRFVAKLTNNGNTRNVTGQATFDSYGDLSNVYRDIQRDGKWSLCAIWTETATNHRINGALAGRIVDHMS